MDKSLRSVLPDLDRTDVDAFYRATLWGLRRLDDLGIPPKRFDPTAEARWTQFQGNLNTSHRIDLLLRDASARFGPAFHGGLVFGLAGLAIDEPFGPAWPSLQPQEARDLWSEVKKAPATEPKALLQLWTKLLKIRPAGKVKLYPAGPAEQLVSIGPSAALKTFEVFMGQTALDWSKSVHVYADTPAGRQLAGLLAVVDPAPAATRLLTDDGDWLAELRAATPRLDRIVVAADPSDSEKAALDAIRGAYRSAKVIELG